MTNGYEKPLNTYALNTYEQLGSAHGLTSGGRYGARQALADLWNAVSSYANPASNGFLSLTHYFPRTSLTR